MKPLNKWLLFVITLGVVVVAAKFAVGRKIYNTYVFEFVAPKLQRELGFRVGDVMIPGPDSAAYPVPGIIGIEPGGVFDQAGFQPGDIPVGYLNGVVGFYQQLNGARGKIATIRIQRPEDRSDWRKARKRSVAIPGP